MTSLFLASTRLEALGKGLYERGIDRTWWGLTSQFGGYIMPWLSLRAVAKTPTRLNANEA